MQTQKTKNVRLVIIGAGGHGREMLDIVEGMNARNPTWEFLGFLADGEQNPSLAERRNASILGGVQDLNRFECQYAIGIGEGSVRMRIDEFARSIKKEAAILVHPLASLGSEIQLDEGCVIAAGAVLTTNIQLGRHTHINIGSSISHDVRIGNWCTISPGVRIAGWVCIEDSVTIGIGAIIKDRIKIGKGAIVGSGSVVIADVGENVTVAGVPAKPIVR